MNDIKPIRLFNIYGERFSTGYAGNVWDVCGLCPTLMTMSGGNRQPLIVEGFQMNYDPILLGYLLPISGKIHQGDRVYSTDGIAVTITAQGANKGGHAGLYVEHGG